GGDRWRPPLAPRRCRRSDAGHCGYGAQRRLTDRAAGRRTGRPPDLRVPQLAVLEAGVELLLEPLSAPPEPEPAFSELPLSEPPLSELTDPVPALSPEDSFFEDESPDEESPFWLSALFLPEPLVPAAARESVL